MPALTRLVEPASFCVTLAQAKAHIRVDHSDDDSLIQNLIEAASDYVERATNVTMTWTRYRWTLETFPAGDIELPRRPLVLGSTGAWPTTVGGSPSTTEDRTSPVVKFIQGYDTEVTNTWLPADEEFRARDGNPPLLSLWGAVQWPLLGTWNPFPVTIDFTAGFSQDGTSVPKQLKQAVLLLVGHWYIHREAASPDGAVPVPYAVEAILSLYESGEYV